MSECLKRTLKHGGGSIMVRGYTVAISVGELVKTDQIINVEQQHLGFLA